MKIWNYSHICVFPKMEYHLFPPSNPFHHESAFVILPLFRKNSSLQTVNRILKITDSQISALARSKTLETFFHPSYLTFPTTTNQIHTKLRYKTPLKFKRHDPKVFSAFNIKQNKPT